MPVTSRFLSNLMQSQTTIIRSSLQKRKASSSLFCLVSSNSITCQNQIMVSQEMVYNMSWYKFAFRPSKRGSFICLLIALFCGDFCAFMSVCWLQFSRSGLRVPTVMEHRVRPPSIDASIHPFGALLSFHDTWKVNLGSRRGVRLAA